MNLDALRAFLTVVDEGSLLAAAKSLRMSRTTVRRWVEELEDEAGVELLQRSRNGAEPTPAGLALVTRGRLILRQADTLISAVGQIDAQPEGELRIAAQVGLPPHLVPPFLIYMRTNYPRLTVHLTLSDDPMGELLRSADLAFFPSAQRPEGPWLVEAITQTHDNLLASKSYLERHGEPTTLEELDQHKLMSWQTPGEDPTLWPTFEGTWLRVSPDFISTDIHILRYCVSAGAGLCLLPNPTGIPSHPLFPDALCPILVDKVGRKRTLYTAYPQTLEGVPRVEVVLRELKMFMSLLNASPSQAARI